MPRGLLVQPLFKVKEVQALAGVRIVKAAPSGSMVDDPAGIWPMLSAN